MIAAHVERARSRHAFQPPSRVVPQHDRTVSVAEFLPFLPRHDTRRSGTRVPTKTHSISTVSVIDEDRESTRGVILTPFFSAHSNVRLDPEQQQEPPSTSAQSDPSPPSLSDTSGSMANVHPNSRREAGEVPSSPSLREIAPPAWPIPTAYHSWYDTEWGPTKVRLHTFLTGREAGGTKPVAGLTASIMLEVATIGYGRQPVGFEVDTPGQANRGERIAYAINRVKMLHEAVRREKTRWDWGREERKESAKRSRRGEAGLGTGGGEPGGIIKSRL